MSSTISISLNRLYENFESKKLIKCFRYKISVFMRLQFKYHIVLLLFMVLLSILCVVVVFLFVECQYIDSDPAENVVVKNGTSWWGFFSCHFRWFITWRTPTTNTHWGHDWDNKLQDNIHIGMWSIAPTKQIMKMWERR